MTTDPAVLPQYRGHPVPWITRWDGEVNHETIKMSQEIATGTILMRYDDGNENRDAHGILWKREGVSRTGKPQFGDVNTYRQRAAMNRRLCQVCGTKIDERPIRWLIPKLQFDMSYDEEESAVYTISAPTCSECIPLARDLCPHLSKEGSVIMRVLDYEVWGVYGQTAGKGGASKPVMVGYEKPWIPPTAVVAYQQVVRFDKFVIEEE